MVTKDESPPINDTHHATSPPANVNQRHGSNHVSRIVDDIDPDDPEYVKNMQRPADVKEDMIDMGARKRVSAVLGSKIFKRDLEQIIDEQIQMGGECPPSLLALRHLSDVLSAAGTPVGNMIPAGFSIPAGMSAVKQPSPCTNANLTPWGNTLPGPALPVNDIRGPDWLQMTAPEKVLRCKLASLFRLVDLLHWSQGVYNHISVRISPEHEHFLLNPFGLLYSEITASSLVKINMQGDILDPGSTNLGISKAGFMIHSAVHSARPDLKCVIHCHTPSVVAVSCYKRVIDKSSKVQPSSLLPLSQEALICAPITGYHEYQGVVLTDHEREQIIRDIGPRNKILILRNHGLLACGSTIEEAFHYAFNVMLACDTQVKALSLVGGNLSHLQMVSDENIAKQTFELTNRADLGVDTRNVEINSSSSITKNKKGNYKWGLGEIMFEGYMRYMDSLDYKTGYPYKQNNVWRERTQRKIYEDVEIPPAAWSAHPFEYYPYDDRLYKVSDWKRKLEKSHWLNSPNAYQKVEITETGTNQPKKITKWVLENGSLHHGTVMREDRNQYLAPGGTDKREFKKLHQEIKDYRRSDKLTAGPQSNVLENSSWEEANKLQEKGVFNGQVDQVIIMGAASKGIIDRNHQHNRQAYQQEYQKNPFDHIEYETAIQDYARQLQMLANSSSMGGGGGGQSFYPDQKEYYVGEGDVTDMLSTTLKSTTEDESYGQPDTTLEEKFNDLSVNVSTTTGSVQSQAAGIHHQVAKSSNVSPSKSGDNTPRLVPSGVGGSINSCSGNNSSGNNGSTTATSAVKTKKKSSIPGFRTPSFLKRKKSKDRAGSSTGGTPPTPGAALESPPSIPYTNPTCHIMNGSPQNYPAKDTAV